jgi:glucan 1,6-alpha-glucosidase
MLHAYLREMSQNTYYGKNLLTVGETWRADPQNSRIYSNPDGSEFSMVFQFEHSSLDQQPGKEKWDLAPLNLVHLKNVMKKWQKNLYQKGWNSLFWNNHALSRIVSRWGNDKTYRGKDSGNIIRFPMLPPFLSSQSVSSTLHSDFGYFYLHCYLGINNRVNYPFPYV